MPFFIQHRPSDVYLGPFRCEPPLHWPLDVDQAKPFASRMSAQAVIGQMAHAFAGDRPDPEDPKFNVSELGEQDRELIKLRRAAFKKAEAEWKGRRDAWVERFKVVDVNVEDAFEKYYGGRKKNQGVTPEKAAEIKAKIVADKTPNVMTQLGSRKLDLGDD